MLLNVINNEWMIILVTAWRWNVYEWEYVMVVILLEYYYYGNKSNQ